MVERRQNYSESQFFSIFDLPFLVAELRLHHQPLELIIVPGSSLTEDSSGTVLLPDIVPEEGMTLGNVRAEGVAKYLRAGANTTQQQLVLIASGYQQLSSGEWHSRAVAMAHRLVELGVEAQQILLVPPTAAWHGNTQGNLRDVSAVLQHHFKQLLPEQATVTVLTNDWQMDRAMEMLDAWMIFGELEDLIGYLTLVSADALFARQSQAHAARLSQLKNTELMRTRTAQEQQGIRDIRSGAYQSQNGPGTDQKKLVLAWERLEQAEVRVTALAFLAALNDELEEYISVY